MRCSLPLAFLLAAAGLQASTFTFTGSSTTVGGCSVANSCSGSATFNITGTDTFTVTLNNTEGSITDAGQLLTDVFFDLSGGSVTLDSSSGTLVSIAGDGTPTLTSSSSLGWGFGNTSGSTFLLCVICGDGVTASAQPTQGIVPTEASYASSNGSIAGNPGHNPFLDSGAMFSFSTSATLDPNATTSPFSNVTLSFGTTFGTEVGTGGGGGGGTGGQTPEPVSMMLAGAGLVGLALIGKRRQNKNQA